MTRCGLAERVKGWPPGCGVRGLCPLAAGFSWRGMWRMRGAAVPLEGDALSLWGIRPISEKEQSLSGKRAFGPFPIQTSLLF